MSIDPLEEEVETSLDKALHYLERQTPLDQGSLEEEVSTPDAEEDGIFLCQECGRTFTTPQGLAAHGSAAHVRQRKPCPECGKGYMQGPGMTRHRQTAHGVGLEQQREEKQDRIYKAPRKVCPDCGKEVAAKDLLRHRRNQHGSVSAPVSRARSLPVTKMNVWNVEDVFNTIVGMLWPNGQMPVGAIEALFQWREATARMLLEVGG